MTISAPPVALAHEAFGRNQTGKAFTDVADWFVRARQHLPIRTIEKRFGFPLDQNVKCCCSDEEQADYIAGLLRRRAGGELIADVGERDCLGRVLRVWNERVAARL